MEDGRNPEPKATSADQFELHRAAQPKEVEKEKLTEFFKTKRALFHSGSSPESQDCDRKILDVKADKVAAQKLDRQMLSRRAQSITPKPKTQERGIEH